MLGKLIKYDLKSTSPILIIIHAFLLIASLMIRFFLTGHLLAENVDLNDPQYGVTLTLAVILYVLLITGVSFGAYFVIIIRFYKNLYSDQGYLTHTLPVTGGQLLLSKTISGSIWGLIDTLLIGLSVYIVTTTPYVTQIFHENISEIRTALGFTGAYASVSFGTVFAIMILFSLLSVIANIIMYYASVSIGHLFPGHKILGAIAAYFVLNTIISMLSALLLIVFGLFGNMMNIPESYNMLEYFIHTLTISVVLSVIISAILYTVSYWIIKKINLD